MSNPPLGKTPLNKISLGELRRQRKRTGLGSVSIVKLIGEEAKPPAPHVIDNWVSGNQPFADTRKFELVMMTYMAQPSLARQAACSDSRRSSESSSAPFRAAWAMSRIEADRSEEPSAASICAIATASVFGL
ncbi:MAG: hypothetical protein AAF250_14165 [Pseudomonadota bacterium]